MKTNKTLLFGTVLAATGIAAMASSHEAKASEQYTIQPGDTLFKISRKFTGGNGFVDEIVNANNIQNRDMIFAGQVITIPTEEEARAQANQAQVQSQPVVEQAPVQQKQEPVQQAPVQKQEPVQQAPVQQKPVVKQQAQAPKQQTQSLSGSEEEAKSWIAMRESTNNYNARNGRYIGKYQLDASYLNGDYSPANQERVANNYVQSRYGSWANAKAFWQSNGWY